MKKIPIILLMFVLIAVLIACGQSNSSSKSVFTTAIAASNGETKYYKIVSDKHTTALVELKLDSNERKTIKKQKSNESLNRTTTLSKKTNTTTEDNSDNGDEFEKSTMIDSSEHSSTKKTTQTAKTETSTTKISSTSISTDDDGWIDKWY